MNSREKILESIRVANLSTALKPTGKPPSVLNSNTTFEERAQLNGSVVIHARTTADVEQLLSAMFFNNKIILKLSEIHPEIDCNTSLEELNKINVAVLQGYLGVIENGAVLVTREQMFHPALPFLCEHLVLILPINKLVNNMIEAYQASSTLIDQYTVFISGPSKTADIEQSLVIGAHGPKSLTIFLLEQ